MSQQPTSAILIPAAERSRLSFAGRALLIPLLSAAAGSLLLMAGNGDQWLADQLFRWQGSQWALKDAWWTSHLIHKGGRNLTWFVALLVILALIRSCMDLRWRPLRRPLAYLLSSVALTTSIVALLKSWTHMDCPWDLERYGGLRPFIGLFEQRPVVLGHAACFPAGHAGSGYAWVALFFFMLQVRPQWRWPALGTALLVGMVFGLAQQLRGAHFASHDLWALAISWLVATVLYLWMFPASASITSPARAAHGAIGENA